MRSYRQFCALARALDVVGDRWTLLLVRELAIRPCRYSDLRDGLPGIATNLLAERLRSLEAAGVVSREEAPPPIASTLYRLTPYGEQLRPILAALARWGSPNMIRGLDGDAFRSRWLETAVESMALGVPTSGLAPLRARLLTGDEPVDLVIDEAGVRAELHGHGEPDVTIETDPETLIGLLSGVMPLDVARDAGTATVHGDAAAIERFASLARRVWASIPASLPDALWIADPAP